MTDAAIAGVLLDAAASVEAPAYAAPPDNAKASGAPATERALPNVDYAIGATRWAILDHFLHNAGDQTMAQIIAGVGIASRNSVEAAVLREYRRGRLLRVAPGTYRLVPPKQPKSPKPPPANDRAIKTLAMVAGFGWPTDPDALADVSEEEWFSALEAWYAEPSTWDAKKLGPPPDQPGHKVPLPILARFRDRVRKRQERQREADAAAARQAAADAELRDQLIAACHGNFVPGPGLDDVAPIRAALETVPLEIVLGAIRSKVDRKIYPPNEPAISWREPRLLKAIAERFCKWVLIPNMVAAWEAAGQAPGEAH